MKIRSIRVVWLPGPWKQCSPHVDVDEAAIFRLRRSSRPRGAPAHDRIPHSSDSPLLSGRHVREFLSKDFLFGPSEQRGGGGIPGRDVSGLVQFDHCQRGFFDDGLQVQRSCVATHRCAHGHVAPGLLRLPSVGGFEVRVAMAARRQRTLLPRWSRISAGRYARGTRLRPRARDGGSGHPAWRRCRAEPDRKR